MDNFIVLGAGYGDEGKGLVTDFLVRKLIAAGRSVRVVRFSGGAQAGHTVVTPEGVRHVFSHFGSGTLAGAHTIWSRFCPVSPAELQAEGEALQPHLERPWQEMIQIDPLCPVTTVWDKEENQRLESRRGNSRHGSCGMGFGTTIGRHETTPYELYALDLAHPRLLREKLKAIRNHYGIIDADAAALDDCFIELVVGMHFERLLKPTRFSHPVSYVFEGSQGILLDQDHGTFPHVTRANTTCKNAIALGCIDPTILYVSRTYHTRHGAGPFHEAPIEICNNENETNVSDTWQGEFRTGPLDTSLLNYALAVDALYAPGCKKALALTCCDQVELPDLKAVHPIGLTSYGPSAINVEWKLP